MRIRVSLANYDSLLLLNGSTVVMGNTIVAKNV